MSRVRTDDELAGIEQELLTALKAVARLERDMRDMAALARMHQPNVVGCHHIDKWADRLAAIREIRND